MTTSPIRDPYAVLGVARDATDDDLDRAFRSVVRQLHPDTRTPSELDADADQRLQELLTAYATLRDPIRRAAYDRSRPATASNASALRPRVRHAPRGPAAVQVGAALRVGSVRWDPLPTTTDGSSGAVGSRRTREGHDGR